jgi:hypothetical protein
VVPPQASTGKLACVRLSSVSSGLWPVQFGGVAGGIRDGLMAGKRIEM